MQVVARAIASSDESAIQATMSGLIQKVAVSGGCRDPSVLDFGICSSLWSRKTPALGQAPIVGGLHRFQGAKHNQQIMPKLPFGSHGMALVQLYCTRFLASGKRCIPRTKSFEFRSLGGILQRPTIYFFERNLNDGFRRIHAAVALSAHASGSHTVECRYFGDRAVGTD